MSSIESASANIPQRAEPAGGPAPQPAVVDAENTARYIQIRGEAEVIHQRAVEHVDVLTRKCTRHPRSYGHVYPHEQRIPETRVTVRIHAQRVTVDAIHP